MDIGNYPVDKSLKFGTRLAGPFELLELWPYPALKEYSVQRLPPKIPNITTTINISINVKPDIVLFIRFPFKIKLNDLIHA